jgi:hypothetical protein
MSENKKCSDYLGVYIAERALSKFFDNIKRMPVGNPGYDFVCGKGFKIDVKSSCLHHTSVSASNWGFDISRNTIADYFLCLAFDNRESLNPMHVWLIPGNVINMKRQVRIANSDRGLCSWLEYERPIDKVVACCSQMNPEVTG